MTLVTARPDAESYRPVYRMQVNGQAAAELLGMKPEAEMIKAVDAVMTSHSDISQYRGCSLNCCGLQIEAKTGRAPSGHGDCDGCSDLPPNLMPELQKLAAEFGFQGASAGDTEKGWWSITFKLSPQQSRTLYRAIQQESGHSPAAFRTLVNAEKFSWQTDANMSPTSWVMAALYAMGNLKETR